MYFIKSFIDIDIDIDMEWEWSGNHKQNKRAGGNYGTFAAVVAAAVIVVVVKEERDTIDTGNKNEKR